MIFPGLCPELFPGKEKKSKMQERLEYNKSEAEPNTSPKNYKELANILSQELSKLDMFHKL